VRKGAGGITLWIMSGERRGEGWGYTICRVRRDAGYALWTERSVLDGQTAHAQRSDRADVY
jgi:hypothetical protein